MSAARELVFVDPSVSGWESIVNNAADTVRVVVLDPTADGLAQIAAAVAGEHDLAAIHIVSHGSTGQLGLGNTVIGAGDLAQHGAALAQIGAGLAAGGDILLYGCDVAQGAAGRLFVQRLAQATGADVAASTGLTGAAALGGNWILEAHVGAIETTALAAKAYAGTLAIVAGTGADDWLDGTAGADTMNGNGGDDTLRSSAGNDIMNGGADGVYGDTVDYSQGPGGVTVNLATGKATDNWGHTDTLSGIEHITGSAFNDTLTGNAAVNWFRPGGGNDTVVGNGGRDVLMYQDFTAAMTINLKAGTTSGTEIGTDKLSGIQNVHSGRGADTVTLTDAGGYVFSGGGDDVLVGGTGGDTFFAGSGNDKIDGGGGAGYDFVRYDDENTDDPNKVLTGKGVTVNLATGKATDNWGDTDTLSGIEAVGGSRHADTITGNAGNNELNGYAGNDVLNGNAGGDNMHGGDGDDTLDGGDDDDHLYGGAGNDTLIGGAGEFDRVHYMDEDGSIAPTGLGVTVNLATGSAIDNWGNTDKLVDIETVEGSRHADIITGDGGNNSVEGQGGDDHIVGAGGGDWLRGGDGNDDIDGGDGRDTLIGSFGNDTLVGGTDYDRVEYWDEFGPAPVTGKGVTVNLATGSATDNWGGTDTLVGIEDVSGSRYGDLITGNAENNNLDGQEGDDTINAGAGNDRLHGGAGNDILDGGADRDHADYWNEFGDAKPTGLGVTINLATGTATDNWGNTDKLIGIEDVNGSRFADTITGDGGDNTLEAQEGNDTVSAGAGNDWLRGGDGDDQLDGGTGRDRVDYYWDYGNKQPTGLGVTVDLAAGKATDNWGDADTLAGIEDATGSRFGDVLAGSAVDNVLEGREGIDTLTGAAGNDRLYGGDGADKLDGGAGDDTLIGGAGNDTLAGGGDRDRVDYWDEANGAPATGAGVTVDLATGKATDNWGNTDTLSGIQDVTGSRYGDVLTGDGADNNLDGREGNDTLVAGAGNDWLGGNEGNDNLQGGAGYDSLSGAAGNDTLDGGADRDRVDYWGESFSAPGNAGVKVDLAAGSATDGWGNSDTLFSIEDVSGSRYGDTIAGNGADNNLSGYDGDDKLSGGAGYDHLTGGAGNDTLDGGADRDNVNYGDTFGQAAAPAAGVTVNLATGIATDNWGNTDTLVGIEDVWGSRYGDKLTGNADNNSLNGNDGNDTIVAGDGGDWLTGGNGADNIQGGNGYDTLTGGSGNDILNGGADRDSVRYSDDVDQSVPITKLGVKVNLATGVATDNWGHTDKLIDIEDVTGSRYADTITGSDADNTLDAGAGNDTVSAGAGNDYLDGGDGNDNLKAGDGYDNLRGGAGTDTLDGGNGNDTVSYNNDSGSVPLSGKGVTVNLVTGNAIDNWGNTDKLLNIENAGGSRFADTLTGNSADNSLSGDSGDDKLVGAGGNDWLDGGSGNDILQGGDGDDYFLGGAGNDTITGGAGRNMVLYYQNWDNDNTPKTGLGVTVDLNTGIATDLWGHTDKLSGIQHVGGSDLADKLTGDAGDNSLYGGGGDDVLIGGAGHDDLGGEGGNDTIDGGAITDLINYTDGNSISFYQYDAKHGVSVNLATNRAYDDAGGVDKLANINEVYGTGFDDTLTGSSRAVLEIFSGGKGDDVINGGAVTDRFNDTNGNRVLYLYADKAVEVDLALGTATGGDGNDILANITQVFGSAHDDVLLGSNTDLVEQFYGAKGNDLIDGRGGLDQVRYAEAAAAVNVNLATGIALDGDGGKDELVDIEGVRGSKFDDTLIGGNLENGVDPDEGLEFFSGERGNDLIDGGVGFDRADYTTSIAAVTVTLGGTGDGTAADGFGGTDTLKNIEAVRGSNFGDLLTGSDSGTFEAFEGRGGNDIIDGKGGIDLVDYTTATAAVNVNLATGTATDGQGGSDKLSNIEWARGSAAGNDVLTGNALANRLEGLGGNDTLNGGAGADTLIGGDGNDTYYVDNAGDIVLETSARSSGGIDRVFASISVKLTANVENLVLQAGAINGTGNALDNVIIAGAGLNTIDGGAGIDTLSFETAAATATSGVTGITLTLGAAGATATASGISGADKVLNIENLTGSKYDDKLTGNSGANVLNGGAGADTLNGGAGKDVLTGGSGADGFVFSTALGSTNVDTITDFGTGDKIRLENAVFTKLATTGTLAAANFKAGTAALDADDFILYDKATGTLSYDADGNGAGAAVKFALVGVNTALTNADFVVI